MWSVNLGPHLLVTGGNMLNCTGCGCTLLKDGSTYCPRCREMNRPSTGRGATKQSHGAVAVGKHYAANLGRLTETDPTADPAIQRADLLAELKRISKDPGLSPAEKTEAAWAAIEGAA